MKNFKIQQKGPLNKKRDFGARDHCRIVLFFIIQFLDIMSVLQKEIIINIKRTSLDFDMDNLI